MVIETVFALPGLGRYFVEGALNRDYPLVLAVVTLYAALIILFGPVADLAYGWPRSKDARVMKAAARDHHHRRDRAGGFARSAADANGATTRSIGI